MFGLGPLEIGLIIALLVLVLGVPRAGRLLGRAFRHWRKIDEVKGQLRSPSSVKTFVLRRGKDWMTKD